MIDMLTRAEMASLDRALARRTHGRVRVGSTPMTVAQAHALWYSTIGFVFEKPPTPLGRLRHRLSLNARRRDDQAMRLLVRGGAIIFATASLGGCTTLGGNVKGSFACRAPDGICAPTSTIDDAALAMIAGEPVGTTPAGPYVPATEASPRTTLTSAQPLRTGEKVLRIVFPAHIDGAGRFRETTAVHAVVERGAWMTAGSTAVVSTRTSALGADTGATATEVAATLPRSLIELATAAPEVRFPDAVADIDAEVASAEVVAPVAVPAATPSRVGLPHTRRTRVAAISTVTPSVVVVGSGPLARSGSPVQVATRGSAFTPATSASTTYSLPPRGQVTTANPMDAIRAQVADRLRPADAGGIAGKAGLTGSALTSMAGMARTPAKPTNSPSMFPVSEVNR